MTEERQAGAMRNKEEQQRMRQDIASSLRQRDAAAYARQQEVEKSTREEQPKLPQEIQGLRDANSCKAEDQTHLVELEAQKMETQHQNEVAQIKFGLAQV